MAFYFRNILIRKGSGSDNTCGIGDGYFSSVRYDKRSYGRSVFPAFVRVGDLCIRRVCNDIYRTVNQTQMVVQLIRKNHVLMIIEECFLLIIGNCIIRCLIIIRGFFSDCFRQRIVMMFIVKMSRMSGRFSGIRNRIYTVVQHREIIQIHTLFKFQIIHDFIMRVELSTSISGQIIRGNAYSILCIAIVYRSSS